MGGFLSYLDIYQDSLDGGSVRRKASTFTGYHNTKTRTTSMPWVEFRPMILVSEWWRPTPQTTLPLWRAKLYPHADEIIGHHQCGYKSTNLWQLLVRKNVFNLGILTCLANCINEGWNIELMQVTCSHQWYQQWFRFLFVILQQWGLCGGHRL
jgi:hypothetical protein